MATVRMSVRGTLSLAMGLLTAMALVTAAALAFVTTRLDRTSSSLGAALDSVHLLERAEIALLKHVRAEDPVVRASLEAELHETLRATEQHVGHPEEALALAEAGRRIEAYFKRFHELAGSDVEPAIHAELEAAFHTLDRLVAMNVAQSAAARDEATAWSRRADVMGMGVAGALLVVVALVLWWLQSAFRPVYRIREAMRRFAAGEMAVRAPEAGPAELRSIARQFNDMADAVQHQHRSRLAFVAGIAHDLRNPLSALSLSTAALGEDAHGTDERSKRMLALVRRQVDHLDRMVGDLLDTVRIEAGRLELRLAEHDLGELAAEAKGLFEGMSPQHRLELCRPGEPVWVRCDRVRIGQVLNNLLSNAIKYSPGGGSVRIEVDRDEEQGVAVAQVSDDGIGIAADQLWRMFEPFEREGTGERHAGIPGHGLGLSVARRIVEGHGGEIQVDSRKGLGSTFRVRLPLHPAAVDARPAAARPAAGRERG